MYAIDNKLEHGKNRTIMFYNMGSMDTEVQIARYSIYNITEKKSAPYIDILGEGYDPELGVSDLESSVIKMLCDKFDSLPERQGKPSV